MAGKAKRARYTLEFKLKAVRLVKAGQSMAAVAETLGVLLSTNAFGVYRPVLSRPTGNQRGSIVIKTSSLRTT